MNELNDLLDRPAAHHHLVQFYGEDSLLVANVVQFLAEGARKGERLVVIATPAHREAFARGLAAEQVSADRLLLLDAEETLVKFMTGEGPDEGAFETVVGRRISGLVGDGTPVRAYGEMVDLLWKSGRLAAAIQLEEQWNRLLKAHKFALYCAYTVDVLAKQTPAGDLESMVDCHSHLLPVRRNGELKHAIDQAMEEVLGAPKVESLVPLIHSTRHRRTVVPGPETTVLWVRKNLPSYAEEILDRARRHYEAACRAPAPQE